MTLALQVISVLTALAATVLAVRQWWRERKDGADWRRMTDEQRAEVLRQRGGDE